MHPDIRKFYEDAGYTVLGPSKLSSYEIHIGNEPFRLIKVICHGNKYYFNKEWYSEEKMLRIVRLKVFI